MQSQDKIVDFNTDFLNAASKHSTGTLSELLPNEIAEKIINTKSESKYWDTFKIFEWKTQNGIDFYTEWPENLVNPNLNDTDQQAIFLHDVIKVIEYMNLGNTVTVKLYINMKKWISLYNHVQTKLLTYYSHDHDKIIVILHGKFPELKETYDSLVLYNAIQHKKSNSLNNPFIINDEELNLKVFKSYYDFEGVRLFNPNGPTENLKALLKIFNSNDNINDRVIDTIKEKNRGGRANSNIKACILLGIFTTLTASFLH